MEILINISNSILTLPRWIGKWLKVGWENDILKSILFVLIVGYPIFSRLYNCGLSTQCNWAEWTGFGAYDAPSETYQRSKTLWDVLTLGIIPLILVLIAYRLNKSQEQSKQKIENDRQQQQSLQTYYDKVSEIISIKDFEKSPNFNNLKNILRTRTLDILNNVNGERKGQILQFIYEAGLIKIDPIINLNGANIKGAKLLGAPLKGTQICGADFSESDFEKANLSNSILKGTIFSRANFTKSILHNSNFEQVDFTESVIEQTDFKNAIVTNATFNKQNIANCLNFTDDMRQNCVIK